MDPGLAAAVRLELRALVTRAGARRQLPTAVHVGVPWSERQLVHVHGDLDQGLRTDLVTRALDGLPHLSGVCVWITRSGPLDLSDDDAAWFAASLAAFARHQAELTAFLVLNRTGWVDHVSTEHRVWTRIRPFPNPLPRALSTDDPWSTGL